MKLANFLASFVDLDQAYQTDQFFLQRLFKRLEDEDTGVAGT